MKKSILIVSHALEIGGAEKSLIGLLDALDPNKWDVDLFLLRHEGEMMGDIPEHVNLLPSVSKYSVLARPMKETLREGHFVLTAARFLGKFAAGRYAKKHGHTESIVALEYSHKFTYPMMPDIQPDKEYDLAVSFLTPHYFVARKVRAKKKIAWIHTDYDYVQVNVKSETAMWDAYDYIASISDAVTDSFVKVFPSLKEKVVLIQNILPARMIKRQAEERIPAEEMPDDGSIRLLSIGRYCNQKNFDNVPDICAKIIQSGLNIKWYIIGFGGDEDLIRSKIEEAGMQDRVILLGKKENPYPYIKACDLYAQPSRYEGNCVTVHEAQLLEKPVVITRYVTSADQLDEGVDGVVVPMDNQGCAQGIAELLCDPNRMQELINNCAERDYSNKCEAEKLYQLLTES